MTRKDKRSMLLSLVIGDGCLHYIKSNHRTYGGLHVGHSSDQADYLAWKANLVSTILGRTIKLRTGNNRGFEGYESKPFIQFQASWIRFKAWRKFIYPNGKKDKSRILRFINNPEFLMSIWLMDDGYVEGKIDKKYNKCYSASLRIFISDQRLESCLSIQDWITKNFNFVTILKYQKSREKIHPFLKINAQDSLLIWDKIREFVLQFKSMQHKFRFLEMRYQYKKSLAQTKEITLPNDIVCTDRNIG
jgi:hypothetical protein